MGDFSFSKGVSIFFKAAKDKNSTEVDECVTGIDHYLFYQLCLIPAFTFSLIMAATNPRRMKLLSFLGGRPGLIYPMDTLTRQSRVAYCSAFGATGFLVYQVLIDQKFAIYYTGTLTVKALIAIVSMLIYGMVFFPLFASLALETAISYFLGSLYVWIFLAKQIYELTECNYNEIGRAVLFTRALPSLICLAYLGISNPIKFCIAIYHKRYLTPLVEAPYSETVEQIQKSYQGKHVTTLLKKPEIIKPPEGFVNSMKARIKGILDAWIYHNRSGFRYPTRLLSVMFVSGCVVYVIAVQALSWFVPVCDNVLETLRNSLNELGPEDPDESDTVIVARLTFEVVIFFVDIVRVSGIIAISLSTILTFLIILHMLSSFRTNLFAIYKGDYSNIPSASKKSAISLCTGSIKYAGFQVAYIVWAFFIVFVILMIVFLVVVVLLKIPELGFIDWLVNKVLQLWPGLVIGIGLFFVQFLLAKFVFLQDKGQYVRLDNRRFYFIFTYFMFFYNIFLGLFSCLMRIIKAIAVGTIFLARLDTSILPRKFEFLDPGFNAYQGYIHVEAAHTNPVVIVFLRLLIASSNSKKKQKSGEKEIEMSDMEVLHENDNNSFGSSTVHTAVRPVNVAARFNWFVTYTLLQNPMVRIYRKGTFQALQKARKEGLKVPISDNPITEFDIVKAQEERDKERTEEVNTINSPSYSMSNSLAGITLSQNSNEEEVKIKQKRNITKRLSWFRKWKKKIGSENSLDIMNNVSDGRKNTESYLKIENV